MHQVEWQQRPPRITTFLPIGDHRDPSEHLLSTKMGNYPKIDSTEEASWRHFKSYLISQSPFVFFFQSPIFEPKVSLISWDPSEILGFQDFNVKENGQTKTINKWTRIISIDLGILFFKDQIEWNQHPPKNDFQNGNSTFSPITTQWIETSLHFFHLMTIANYPHPRLTAQNPWMPWWMQQIGSIRVAWRQTTDVLGGENWWFKWCYIPSRGILKMMFIFLRWMVVYMLGLGGGDDLFDKDQGGQ